VGAKPSISFKNLAPGDYTFIVKGKFANSTLDNTATYSFTILKLVQTIAVFIYLIFIIVIVSLISL
jgi:hypothetical protein